MSALIGNEATWYLMRASGFVALLLVTASTALGIAGVGRWQRGRWTRTVGLIVHRDASLLAVVFIALHVLSAVTDSYVSVPASASVVPWTSGYDPLWVGLGALSLDLVLAVVATSLLRDRIGRRAWRAVHWLSYASLPVAVVHSVGAGSGAGADTGAAWSTAVYLAVGLAFALAVAARLRMRRRPGDPTPLAGAPAVATRQREPAGRAPRSTW